MQQLVIRLVTGDEDAEHPCPCGHVARVGERAVLVAGRDGIFCVGHEPKEQEKRIMYLTKARLIDTNFYRVTAREARALCGGRLPKACYGKRVAVEGYLCWVEQTLVGGRVVWALHNSYDKAD